MRRTLIMLCSVLAFGHSGSQIALAQHTLYAVSGQGRASPTDAQHAAKIGALESENQERLDETSQNANDISANSARLDAVETTCSAGQMLRWNGAAWTCVSEQDPTVGAHAKKTSEPPDCHDTNAKLLWNASSQEWHCAQDMNDASAGSEVSCFLDVTERRSCVSQPSCPSGYEFVNSSNIDCGGYPPTYGDEIICARVVCN